MRPHGERGQALPSVQAHTPMKPPGTADLALHGMRVVLLRAQRQTGLICACLPSCQFWRAFRFLSVLVTFTAYLSRNVRQN